MNGSQSFSNTMLNSVDRGVVIDPMRLHMECLDLAGRMVEKQINSDSTFTSLVELAQIGQHGHPTVSGLSEHDYGRLNFSQANPPTVKQLTTANKVPLPPEVVENLRNMQCQCMMGLFTEIQRAWMTIDSDIYIWTYEGGSDVAFYEGLGEMIVSVGLVKPKPGVFHSFVEYLLILTTATEIVILGVTFSNINTGQADELNLLPDPVFVIPTDGVAVNTVCATAEGRIFLGARDGSLLEVVYQAEGGWFGKRCRKVNHSTSSLSFLLPSFLTVALSDEGSVMAISVDNSRHILYTLSDKGTIAVYDLGEKGDAMSRKAHVTQADIVKAAVRIRRTFDNGMYSPVKSISALELSESMQLNLVAVTEGGVRLYFTATSVPSPALRPRTLALAHVRLPPGYAGGNPPAQRPGKVHTALYRRGTLLLVSSSTADHDTLWCLSSASHPWMPFLFEAQSALPLDGVAWALAEVKAPSVAPAAKYAELALTPLAVRQQYEPPAKFVVLTTQGAEVLRQLRPVDQLRQLLAEGHGPDGPGVRGFFSEHHEEQACATSLLIACNETAQNAQMAEWATRAFFLYGGEPQIGHAPAIGNPVAGSPSFSAAFNPGGMSTPFGGAPPPAFASPVPPPATAQTDSRGQPLHFSAKHDGLYLYLGRILRPLWGLRAAIVTQHENGVQFLCSMASQDDCVDVLGHLQALHTFLEKNTRFVSDGRRSHNAGATAAHSAAQEAQLEEKRSLDALKVFVKHACEVIGLWRILCEHQFHVVAALLEPDLREQLTSVGFRQLLLVGHDLCARLVSCLISRYLNDNASVDAISAKLRDVCPNLYRDEDAACSKANEMLLKAKATKSPDERQETLQAALDMCTKVAPQINLSAICQRFAASQFYKGILELSTTCAARLDPKDAGVHYYKHDEPSEDHEGYQAYLRRMECYKEVTVVLDQLFGQSQAGQYASNLTSPSATSICPGPVIVMDTEAQARKLLDAALDAPDELLHVALYDWMMSKRLHTDLISVTQPSLEGYLRRAAARGHDSALLSDLLWKYYEKKNDHAAAAKILYKLAVKEGPHTSLSRRVECLARAVMCLRSDRVGSAPQLGVFLRQLEDLIEVARLQQQILACVVQQHGADADDAIARLNSTLLDITVLYESFAEPYALWECKLAIVHCSGHNDVALVENIWLNLIEREVSAAAADDKMAVLLGKVKTLGREYELSPRCFPLTFLVHHLERQSCRLGADPRQAMSSLLDLGVSFSRMLEAYDALAAADEPCWANEGDPFHVVKATATLVQIYVDNYAAVAVHDRHATTSRAADAVASCLSLLYNKPDTDDLIALLRGLQAKLERIDR